MSERAEVGAAIRVRGLGKRYGRKRVLAGLDLVVPRGAVTAVLGPNGAGKSTLLAILAGMLPRDGGDVSVLGRDPARDPLGVKARVGVVPEDPGFHQRWRVRDAIGLARGLRGKAWDRTEEARLLDAVALPLAARIGELSKGMRAKLALLLALGHRPALVLLDEPASGLDPVVRREVLGAMVDAIAEQGRTVILSTHRMDDVERLADRVAFLDGGRIVREGPVEEVRGAGPGNLEDLYLDLLGREREATPCGA